MLHQAIESRPAGEREVQVITWYLAGREILLIAARKFRQRYWRIDIIEHRQAPGDVLDEGAHRYAVRNV